MGLRPETKARLRELVLDETITDHEWKVRLMVLIIEELSYQVNQLPEVQAENEAWEQRVLYGDRAFQVPEK